MPNKLKKLLEFCVENKLLDATSSERIACEYERYWDDAFDIVLKHGIDERKMYEVAAKVHQIQLVILGQVAVDINVLNFVSLDIATKMSCIPYAINSSELSVVIYDWEKWEVVTQSMENLTGKKTHANLISYTDFQSMYKRLAHE